MVLYLAKSCPQSKMFVLNHFWEDLQEWWSQCIYASYRLINNFMGRFTTNYLKEGQKLSTKTCTSSQIFSSSKLCFLLSNLLNSVSRFLTGRKAQWMPNLTLIRGKFMLKIHFILLWLKKYFILYVGNRIRRVIKCRTQQCSNSFRKSKAEEGIADNGKDCGSGWEAKNPQEKVRENDWFII